MKLLQGNSIVTFYSHNITYELVSHTKEIVVSHRCEHLHALAEVADEGHDGHLLHEPLDFAELQHEAVLVRQALQRLALLLELPQDFNLILRGLEAHQTLYEVHRQSS